MLTSDFDYNLPTELIAQTPLEPRDSSRLLVLDRASGEVQHRHFTDILEYLRPGDVMVFNQSRVIHGRLRGRRADTGGKVEFLLLREQGPGVWQAMAQPGRRLRPGAVVILDPPGDDFAGEAGRPAEATLGGGESPLDPPFTKGGAGIYSAEVLASHDDGTKTIRLSPDVDPAALGQVPLPPYIRQRLEDPERYQTVYAKDLGSAAAPTAGLHFTQQLLGRIQALGVEQVFVTLHVGLDTFRPVQGEDPAEHRIHTEYFEIDAEAAHTLNRAKREGRRVIAVGTTSVRVLEMAASSGPVDGAGGGGVDLKAQSGWTDLFILPGHRFKLVDAMVTNFHLPRSTLLMLVSAFVESGGPTRNPSTGSGRAVVLAAYQEAIAKGYRFYSFGDCMFTI